MIFKKKPFEERVYTKIFDMPLSNFIEVICDKKLLAMRRPGEKASEEECLKGWKLIFDAYVDAVMDKDSEYLNKTELRIQQLAYKINLVETCATFLRGYAYVKSMGRDMDGVDNIIFQIKKESGTQGKFDINDPEQWERDIKMAEAAVKRYQIEIDSRQAELRTVLPRNPEQIVSREVFLTTLARMNRWAKIRFIPSEITLFEFVKNLNDWRNESEQIKRDIKRK